MATTRRIRVSDLARVEGEGRLSVEIRGDVVEDVQLEIFEPPRFFEAFLRGRDFAEAPDITSRICGICPVAYQMSSVQAMEDAIGAQITPTIRALRRLLYCGEWIESHALHVFLLHAPDFLGYPSAIEMAREHREVVERGLKLKKTGNDILRVLGGREIHPINVRVGGFYRLPHPSELSSLRESLHWAREAAEKTVRWAAALAFPASERSRELVSLRHDEVYPMNGGRIVSSHGLDTECREFNAHFVERHERRSTALHAHRRGGGSYLCGPIARYNQNFDRLPDDIRELAKEVGMEPPRTNPFHGIAIRSIEILYACEEALRILETYEPSGPSAVTLEPREGEGHGATEAPRGLLYHRYRLTRDGKIAEAQIVPPTSQNQKSIEEDLLHYVQGHVALTDDELRLGCERTIRNYDPCISCATHFLKLDVSRS
jgi:sulfhydrogenase subunit alpha